MRGEIATSRQRFERLERECRLRERPLALAMIDIDDFKRLNDELGHQSGDRALRHLCVELREGLGASAMLADDLDEALYRAKRAGKTCIRRAWAWPR